MKNFDSQEAYPQLFNAFSKVQFIHPVIMQEFMDRSETIQFKRNEVIENGEELSTHGYFIVSGLIMGYIPHEGVNLVKWIRSSDDYAYSMDMFRFRFGYEPDLTGNVLVALEDTLAIHIKHEDLNWLQDNSVEMGIVVNSFLEFHTAIDLCLKENELREPTDKYKHLQRQLSFNLNRVPDIYLASFLNITLAELKKVRESIQQ